MGWPKSVDVEMILNADRAGGLLDRHLIKKQAAPRVKYRGAAFEY